MSCECRIDLKALRCEPLCSGGARAACIAIADLLDVMLLCWHSSRSTTGCRHRKISLVKAVQSCNSQIERLQGIPLDFVSSRSEAVCSSVRHMAQGATQCGVVRVFALPRPPANIVRSMCCRPSCCIVVARRHLGRTAYVLSTSSRPCSLVVHVIHRPQAQHVCVLLFCTLFRSGGWLQLRIEVVMRQRFPRLCTVVCCARCGLQHARTRLVCSSGLVASLGLLALLLYGTRPLLSCFSSPPTLSYLS